MPRLQRSVGRGEGRGRDAPPTAECWPGRRSGQGCPAYSGVLAGAKVGAGMPRLRRSVGRGEGRGRDAPPTLGAGMPLLQRSVGRGEGRGRDAPPTAECWPGRRAGQGCPSYGGVLAGAKGGAGMPLLRQVNESNRCGIISNFRGLSLLNRDGQTAHPSELGFRRNRFHRRRVLGSESSPYPSGHSS